MSQIAGEVGELSSPVGEVTRSLSNIEVTRSLSNIEVTRSLSNIEVTRSLRDIPPAHCTFKIESFSILLETLIEKFESNDFEASGYKWKLSFYPNGNKNRDVKDHISLYLEITDTNKFPSDWEINVNFKLFVFDHIRDKYLAIQDVGQVRRFHRMKIGWGFDHFLSLDTFKNASNGYLVDNCCVFGAEIYVINTNVVPAVEVSRSLRDVQPADYLFKIESFSILLETQIEKYESNDFEVGGYKWRLSFYPNGNKKKNVKDHISLYLQIADSDSLPRGWEVNVNFKFFVFDHIHDKYLAIEDAGKLWRFRKLKIEWGFDQFFSLDTLKNASNGYLVDDCCVFGAEVFVIKQSGKGECLSMKKEPYDINIYTWRVDKFSSLSKEGLSSDIFKINEWKWKLQLYSKGDPKAKGQSLSFYLTMAECEKLPQNCKLYANYKLRVKDQVDIKHYDKEASSRFSASCSSWGFQDFMLLSDLNDSSKGFLVDDTIMVEVEFVMWSLIKNFT